MALDFILETIGNPSRIVSRVVKGSDLCVKENSSNLAPAEPEEGLEACTVLYRRVE